MTFVGSNSRRFQYDPDTCKWPVKIFSDLIYAVWHSLYQDIGEKTFCIFQIHYFFNGILMNYYILSDIWWLQDKNLNDKIVWDVGKDLCISLLLMYFDIRCLKLNEKKTLFRKICFLILIWTCQHDVRGKGIVDIS